MGVCDLHREPAVQFLFLAVSRMSRTYDKLREQKTAAKAIFLNGLDFCVRQCNPEFGRMPWF